MKKITRKEKKRLIIIFGVVLFIGLLLVLCRAFVDDARDVVRQYAYGMRTYNAEKIVDLYKEEMIFESYESRKDMVKDYEEMFQELKDDYYRINDFEINDNYKIYEGEELKYQKDKLKEYYGIEKKIVEEIRLYTITFDCNDDGEAKETEQSVLIAKMDGHWYYIGNE